MGKCCTTSCEYFLALSQNFIYILVHKVSHYINTQIIVKILSKGLIPTYRQDSLTRSSPFIQITETNCSLRSQHPFELAQQGLEAWSPNLFLERTQVTERINFLHAIRPQKAWGGENEHPSSVFYESACNDTFFASWARNTNSANQHQRMPCSMASQHHP